MIKISIAALNNDRTTNLHTRSLKYGKLENGILVSVHNKLVICFYVCRKKNIFSFKLRRQKHHFVKLDCGVFLILAHNGNIWISEKENNQTKELENQKNKEKEQTSSNETREKMAKVLFVLSTSVKKKKFLDQKYFEIAEYRINRDNDRYY